MTFKIDIKIFCDECGVEDHRASASVSGTPDKKENWRISRFLVWEKISKVHICAGCRLKEISRNKQTRNKL